MTSADATPHVLQTSDAGVLHLTLNRPEKKNALTQAMYTTLADAFEQAARDDAVRVILLSGAGDNFTSGADLGDFLHNPPVDDSRPVMRFLQVLSQAPKPVIAAPHGTAVGIGTTLLLHCDLVYAATDTQFRLPFVSLGLCPEAGSSVLLPQRIGHVKAAELLLLGEPFSAEQALALGLVNALYPADQLLAAARARAQRLAAQPAAAVRLSKRLLKQPGAEMVQEAIVREGRAFLERLQSAEAKEAFQAFFERRKPDFSRFN